MKISKSLVWFVLLAGSISSCFREPEFSSIPSVSNLRLEFYEVEDDIDSLVLTFDFKDGDGNLGLGPTGANLPIPDDESAPFHSNTYYLEDGSGDLIPVVTRKLFDNPPYNEINVIEIPPGASGLLVTNRTRNKPNYGYLEPYLPNTNICQPYRNGRFMVLEDDNILDTDVEIIEVVELTDKRIPEGEENRRRRFVVIEDILYTQPNLLHNNFIVQIFQRKTSEFEEFDWYENFCVNLGGRIPRLKPSGNPLEGTLRYVIPSDNFVSEFGSIPLQIKIRLVDRSLNESNTLRSPEFTLDRIRVD